jgi:uncharacterized protein
MSQERRVIRCTICRAEAAPRAENAAYPFCSERCRQIDLGRWLQEDYRIPMDPETSDEDPRGSDEG